MATEHQEKFSSAVPPPRSSSRCRIAAVSGVSRRSATPSYSSFFIDDILGGDVKGSSRRQGGFSETTSTPVTRHPPRPVPLYPSTASSSSNASSPASSAPHSPVDVSGGWASPCMAPVVSPEALALDGGGVLGDFRLLPPPFALFHQNVLMPTPNHGQHQHHYGHNRHDVSGSGPMVTFGGGSKTYLDVLTDASFKGSLDRWGPLHCHLLALRQGRSGGLLIGDGSAGAAMAGLGICANKRKGGQVRFSAEQTNALEKRFGGHKYLSPEERRILAEDLKLTDRQVKTWFQNRRAKWRRSSQSSAGDGVDRGVSQSDDIASSSRFSTSSSCLGVDPKECESDVDDEVFREEPIAAT